MAAQPGPWFDGPSPLLLPAPTAGAGAPSAGFGGMRPPQVVSLPEPLAGLVRPIGDPPAVFGLAVQLQGVAQTYRDRSADLRADAQHPQHDWRGVAAVKFTAHANRIVTETLRVAVAYTQGAAALNTWAQELTAAQSDYDDAADIAVLALAQEHAAASAAFHDVLTNTVHAVPGPLRAVAQQQARHAIARADRAAAECVTALSKLTPHVSPPHGGGGLGHTTLDAVGAAPVVGIPADLLNAALYEHEGDHVDAAASAAGALPFAGGAATAAKLGRRGLKAAKAGEHAAKDAAEGAAGAAARAAADTEAAAERLASGLPGPEEVARLRAVPGNSKDLGENLIAAGHVRPPQTDAHHVVAKLSPKSAEARDLLAQAWHQR